MRDFKILNSANFKTGNINETGVKFLLRMRILDCKCTFITFFVQKKISF